MHLSLPIPPSKPVRWIGPSHAELKSLPADAQHEAGYQLWLVQCGNPPDDCKPMNTIGAGVYEIRIHTQTEHRVLYVAKHPEAVYVLHVFEKRTRKTSPRNIEIGRRRFKDLAAERRARGS